MSPDMRQDRTSRRKRARQIVAARLERLEDLSVGKLVPSTLTLAGLCSGATAMRFALEGDWTHAVLAVVFAMIFDMLDGRAARLLGADSRFGAQLDSLADLVSFGLAPTLIMFTWTLRQWDVAGWGVGLIFCACSAIRLARFNVESVRDEGATKANPYFTGLPTPAAACMMLLPLLLSFQWNGAWARDPALAAGVAAITAFLMVSRLPTPSIKYMKLQRQHRTVAIACFAGVAALLIVWPWATLTVGLVLYIASIPLAIGHYHPRIAARRAG
jgi:CDP-diacylglycerol--serine O-phosphatidyltransferase